MLCGCPLYSQGRARLRLLFAACLCLCALTHFGRAQEPPQGTQAPETEAVTASIQDNGTNKFITVSPAPGSRFYRLSRP